jgi:hypothetical protein
LCLKSIPAIAKQYFQKPPIYQQILNMGWFWGSSDSSSDKATADPFQNLDPKLKEFLNKESPVKYTPTEARPAPPQTAQHVPTPTTTGRGPNALSQTTQDLTAQDEAPKSTEQLPTLYKDGRYAHLWKTYTPQSAVEASTKSDAEKISDVLEGYKYRRAAIGRAALENCALEQEDVNRCFRQGGFVAKVTLCRDENKQLERCVVMQQKFLKALGYLSTLDRSEAEEERIQMHADRLYHRMLEQEERVHEAEKKGLPIPVFEPLITPKAQAPMPKPEAVAAETDPKAVIARLPEKLKTQIEEELKGLHGLEREISEKALVAEIQAGKEVKGSLKHIYQETEEERRRRKEEGRETITDRLSGMLGGRK